MKKGKVMLILLIVIISIIAILIFRNSEIENETSIIENAKTKIVLYFSNSENGELTREYRYVNMDDIKNEMPVTIIQELIKGPDNIELDATIPHETKLNSVLVEYDRIIIDFSKEFMEDSGDELKELHKIYSVVNSLTEITEINEVEIKVEGKTITNKVRL